MAIRRWQLMAVFIVCAIVIPAVYFATIGRDEPRYSTDGDFDDWSGVPMFTTMSPASSPSIDVVEWSVVAHSGILYLYVETAAPMMAGGSVEGLVLFIDTDGSEETGYDLVDIGADAMIKIQGWNGSVYMATCSAFGSSDDRLNWSAWSSRYGVICSLDGSRMEASARLPSVMNGTSAVMLSSMGEGVVGCKSYPVPVEGGLLVIQQTASEDIASDGISDAGIDVIVSTLTFTCQGSGGMVESVSPELVGFESLEPGGSFSLDLGEEVTVNLRADLSSTPSGQFISAVVTPDSVQSSFTRICVLGTGTKAYVAFPPSEISVDGAFADWIGLTVTDIDSEPVDNPNIDIDEVSVANGTDSMFLFVSVYGEMCAGTCVPELCSKPVGTVNGTIVPLRRTGEDIMRIYLDTDMSTATGLRVAYGSLSIGADWLAEVAGIDGEVKRAALSLWAGEGWAEVLQCPELAIDDSRMEMRLDTGVVGDSEGFSIIVVTTDWSSSEDTAVFLAGDVQEGKQVDLGGLVNPYRSPIIESLPEFSEIALPVVFVLVTFVTLIRRRRRVSAE